MEEKNNTSKTMPKKENKISIIKIANQIGKIILSLIYTLLAIIVIVLIYNIIQISILNKPYMNIFGHSFFRVQTGSMSGTMEIGDIIIVKLTKDVQQNDIITYESDNMLITHRIIEKEQNSITTKGDANNAKDEPITQEDVIGKVVYIFKNVAIWKQVLKTPEVYTLIVITLILFGITISIEDEKKQEKVSNKKVISKKKQATKNS